MINLSVPSYKDDVVKFLKEVASGIELGKIHLRGFSFNPTLEISEHQTKDKQWRERQGFVADVDLRFSVSNQKILDITKNLV